MTIPTITEYLGVVPDRRSQSAEAFTQAAISWTDYQADTFIPSINTTAEAMNLAVVAVDDSTALAQDAAATASSSANYQGDWFIGAAALKGQSWSHNGFLWRAKQNSVVEPTEGAFWLLINSAKIISTKTSESAQDFIDSFALKVFQSPTDGLTKISTRTLLGGEVYEVRKVSDDSLATIYSDKEGLNPIAQNGTSNVSGSDGVVEFYVDDGDYTVTINAVSAGLDVGHINNLSLPYVFDTVADFKASLIEFPDGKIIHLKDRCADFTKITGTGTANTFDIIASTSVNQSVSVVSKGGAIDVINLGAVADATPQPNGAAPPDGTDWSELFNYAYANYKKVIIAAPTNGLIYKAEGIQLQANSVTIGTNREAPCLNGMGGQPVFLTNTSPSSTVRNIEMYGMHVQGDGHPAIDLVLSPDFICQRNTFKGYRSPAVNIDLSVRGALNYNKIQSSAGDITDVYALKVIEGNGGNYKGNIISGGQGGGAIDIGRTQVLDASNNVIEVSGLTAIRVGRNEGLCTSINLRQSYFEQVISAFEIGYQFNVLGVDISGSRIGNTDDNVITTRSPAIKLGRVSSMEGVGLTVTGNNLPNEYVFAFADITNGVGSFPFLDNSNFSFSTIEGYIGNYTTEIFPVIGRLNNIFGNNQFDLYSDLRWGVEKTEEIHGLTANVGETFQVIPKAAGGGLIKKVEIFRKSGNCTCIFNLGWASNAAENLSVDPQTLTYDAGYVEVAGVNEGIRLNQGINLSISAGAGTGSFSVRITYRVGG